MGRASYKGIYVDRVFYKWGVTGTYQQNFSRVSTTQAQHQIWEKLIELSIRRKYQRGKKEKNIKKAIRAIEASTRVGDYVGKSPTAARIEFLEILTCCFGIIGWLPF